MASRTPDIPWRRELGSRLVAHWPFKAVATPAFMALFFVAYFQLLRHPVFPVTVMPLTAPDRWIAFRPETLALYVSLWVYVPLAPSLLRGRREITVYLVAATGLSLGGLAVFFFWPTTIPRPEIDWTRYPSFQFLQGVDAAGNACPSLHVAFAVFTALWLERLLRQLGERGPLRWLNALWCAGIVYSTLATKQHVAVDALAGAALGALAALPRPSATRSVCVPRPADPPSWP